MPPNQQILLQVFHNLYKSYHLYWKNLPHLYHREQLLYQHTQKKFDFSTSSDYKHSLQTVYNPYYMSTLNKRFSGRILLGDKH